MKTRLFSSRWQAFPIIMAIWLMIGFLALNPTTGFSQSEESFTLTGKALRTKDGTPLIGATVFVMGTNTGATTGEDGSFSVKVPNEAAVLSISYLGFETQKIKIGNNRTLNIQMVESIETLDNVVITALGIKRSERALGYSVGKVSGEEVSRVVQENVLDGLAAKVPGVTISSIGGSGSSVSMVIRGASSLNGDNQPLFVVDGVPLANTLNNVSQVGRDNRVDYGNAISDINPNDIESISILKGPSAAALYGSRAGNGVVLITTKSGADVDRMTVSVSSSIVFDRPVKFLNFSQGFAMGGRAYTPDNHPFGPVLIINSPVLGVEAIPAGNGPELDKGYEAIQWNSPIDPATGFPIPLPLESHPDNVKNFLRTGITTTNTVSLANGNDMMNYRLSYTNMTNQGIIPNSDLFRNSLGLSTSVKASEKLRISTNINYTRSNSNNRPAGNRGANPLQWAYSVPSHIDIADLEDYWEPGLEGIQQKSFLPGDANNPYFMANEINNAFLRDRVYGNVRADWQITPEFSFMARIAMDQYDERRETTIAHSYTLEDNGGYGLLDLNRTERNADVLATYSKDLNDFSVSVSAGGNILNQNGSNVRNATKTRGSGLVIPGLFNLSNIVPDNLDYSNSFYQKAIYSAYGMVNLGWKDMVYLDLTARNDWSSTLPAENRSYFYPSASMSLVLSEMIPMPKKVDLFKFRIGWAQAGNDANPYALTPILSDAGSWAGITRLGLSGNLLTPDLKPEISTSFEYGVDLVMFKNRLRLEATIYDVDNENQILGLRLPPSSGFSSKTINAGRVASKGWEFMLSGTPIQTPNFSWDVSANISRNRTTIEELTDGVEIFTLWTDAKGGAWTYVGEEIGDIYDRKVVVVEDESSPYHGYPILDSDGSWQDINATQVKNKIGNFNPDFILGGQTSFRYKNFRLSMTFDWRKGGQFVSQTYRYSESDMRSQRWLDQLIDPGGRTGDDLRNWLIANEDELIRVGDGVNIVGGPTPDYGGFPLLFFDGITLNDGVFNPGVYIDADGNYIENLGGPDTKFIPYAANYAWDFTKTATFDADFIKLREVALSYSIPTSLTDRVGMQGIDVGVFSRNIILWTAAKIGIDPERAFQHESSVQGGGSQFKQGIERYNVMPFVIPIGVKLGLTF